MTSSRARFFAALLSFVFLMTLLGGPGFLAGEADAGQDDFEYGRALAALGTKTGDKAYFTYARRVFDKVIADENRSEAMKDLCRYGIAEMTKSAAIGASGNPEKKYTEVRELFRSAVETMEAFVKKNPDHEKADEARLGVGTTRLAFVQWARDLLETPEKREERGASMTEVQTDAESFVRGAIGYFEKIRKGFNSNQPSQISQIAQYYWVLCQYYLALVYEPGTDQAEKALVHAALQLDDFITLNDGQLLAIYAQDIMGLTRWEQARQATGTDEKASFYGKAVEWFGTCIDTPVEDLDSQRVVANGYFHLGQVCNEAGRVGTLNFHRIGVSRLKDMLVQHKTIWRQDNGIRALLELARLELNRDRQAEAVEIARKAGEFAKKLGKGWLERQANRILQEIVTGGGGGGGASADPTVLMRVAEAIYSEQKWSQAIAAYQQVIASVERNPKNAEDYLIRSWERISRAYKEQGDLVAAALALEPIHGIWVDGLVDKATGGKDNPNLHRLGTTRLKAQNMWKQLHTLTGSGLFDRRHAAIRNAFSREYPGHPGAQIGEWNGAMDKYRLANDQKQKKNSRWRTTVKEADALFRRVTKDKNSPRQDQAWTFLIYTQFLRDDWRGMLKAAAEANAFWDSAAAKAQAEKFETVAQRRRPERGKAAYWEAEALYQLASDESDEAKAGALWDKILKLLDGWHVEYEMLRPVSGKRYYVGTLGHIVFAHIGKGDIPSADESFKRVLAEDPKYFRLPKITFALARHWNDQARTIDDERKKYRIELNGTEDVMGARTRLRSVAKRAHGVLEYRVDLESLITKDQEVIDLYNEKVKAGDPIEKLQKAYDEAVKRLPETKKKVAELTEQGNKLTAEQEKLTVRVAELVKLIKEKAQLLYEPLVRAAGYFWEWDAALRAGGLDRDPGNVAIFADLYFKAGLLRPRIAANWERARSLYEDYLGFSEGAEDKKQEALGRLGTIYARLARASKQGSEERTKLVAHALDRLQGSLALIPENNDIVVAHLEGKIIVIQYKDTDINETFYFPFTRIKTVDEFKKVVAQMGKTGGTPLPTQETDIERRKYQNAVGSFRNRVNGMTPAALARTVKGFEGAGFDMRLHKRLARSQDDFRLALAWIYIESGEPANMTKAYNLASSLLAGTYAADEDGEDWWEAQVLRLDSIVTGAEIETRKTPSGGKLSPTAAAWIERASTVLRGVTTTNPSLGDEVRPETRQEFKDLQSRIKILRGRAGLKSMDLFLDKMPDVPVVPEKKDDDVPEKKSGK